MSLGSARSVALYTGSSAVSLPIDNNTISGSTTSTIWIRVRSVVNVTSPLVVAVSSVVCTATVVTAGTVAGFYMIRLTILQIA
jgi:hypothetical protein